LNALTEEVRDDRSWKHEFKESLDRQSGVIDKILRGLEDETKKREKDDESIRTNLDSMSGIFTTFKNIWVVALLIITAMLSVRPERY
jgi:hypothetical protein